MVTIKFTSKGQGDKTPSVMVSALRNAGLINARTKTNVGDVFELTLINSGGIPTVIPFRVNRKSGSTMMAEGWNHYLLDMPKVGEPVEIGVAGIEKVKSARKR